MVDLGGSIPDQMGIFSPESDTLLLEIGAPFRLINGILQVELQAANGLRLWKAHFSHVTVCAVLLRSNEPETGVVWVDTTALKVAGGIDFVPLPWSYQPRDHFRNVRGVREQFRSLVRRHQYVCITSFGLFGAWGNILAQECRSQGRSYAVWLDWVLHLMFPKEGTFVQRTKANIKSTLTKIATNHYIGKAGLGLFHGRTVFDAYSHLCDRAFVVHDIHVHPQDVISQEQFSRKMYRQRGVPLRIGYVGRMHPMKAPLQWIEAMKIAADALGHNNLRATWLGDGPLLSSARERVSELGLRSVISLPGFQSDRQVVLEFLREQDILVFCHLTPESPRCLLEALVSGTPIVGYRSSYAQDLLEENGGGFLTPCGEPAALAKCIVELGRDYQRLNDLIKQTSFARERFTDEAVFAHRSELIKGHLTDSN